ncbi:MAG: BACON domain-containing protein [Synergistaceae bacterium]|nr:BACON domain-containing protein [Synergistaceae bacterium]
MSARSSVNLKSEFVIMVTKAEWKKYPSLKLSTEFKSEEGGTEGGGALLGIGNRGRRDWSYDWSKKQNDYTVPRPPHIAVTQAKFNFKATAAKGDTQVVTLQSEENWTAKTNASWIHLTTTDNDTKAENGLETLSGNATGSSQKQIMISVDAVTDGKPRGGKIVFTASDGETCVVEILQAGN